LTFQLSRRKLCTPDIPPPRPGSLSSDWSPHMKMTPLALAGIGIGLCTTVAFAQDPVKSNPKHYHVLVDNAQVRVLHVIVGPGEKTTMHEHPDNVTVMLTDGKIAFTGADGKSDTVETKAGQAMWSAGPQKHMGTNPGTAAIEAIVVELKGKAAPKATLPASRPGITRTTLLENPRADVFKFTADPTFKEAPATTHDYDQVLIALAPATISLEIGGKTTTTLKRGDVAFIGRGQAHQAQNVSGKPQELVVVAIK
jgi:beta-alanine degradation protein BauB